MPYTFGIIGDEDSIKSTTFRKNLREKAEGKQLKNGAFLSATAQNRLKRGQALAVALAIERERMLETKLSDEEYQLSFDIDATILAFNFAEKAIVSSNPIKLTLLTSYPRNLPNPIGRSSQTSCFLGTPKNNGSRTSAIPI